MSKVIIGKFGPSARQILDAALAIASSPRTTLVVGSKPEGSTVFGDAPYEGRRKKDYERGLSYLHDLASHRTLVNRVFLGGACDPTTWRKDAAIPMLENAQVAYYNPQVADWSEQDAKYKAEGITGGIMEVEAKEKTASYVLLFVFDSQTRAIATINEAVEFMLAGQQKVVLVADYVKAGLDVGGQALTWEEAMDINIARGELFGVAKARGVPVFYSINEAIEKCIDYCQRAEEDHHVIEVAG